MIKEPIPCPFCGGSDLIVKPDMSEDDNHVYAYHVFCRDCHAQGRNNYPIGWCESEKEAIEAWNSRPRIIPDWLKKEIRLEIDNFWKEAESESDKNRINRIHVAIGQLTWVLTLEDKP